MSVHKNTGFTTGPGQSSLASHRIVNPCWTIYTSEAPLIAGNSTLHLSRDTAAPASGCATLQRKLTHRAGHFAPVVPQLQPKLYDSQGTISALKSSLIVQMTSDAYRTCSVCL